MEIHENIKRLRKQRGLSQEELAHLVGYTDRSSIAKIEAGRVDLSQSKIASFATALGTTPAELLGWETGTELMENLLNTIAENDAHGCYDAEEKMYQSFGTEREKLGTRIVGNKVAVLFYHAFDTSFDAVRMLGILDILRSASSDDLLAIDGMIRGYANRQRLDDFDEDVLKE